MIKIHLGNLYDGAKFNHLYYISFLTHPFLYEKEISIILKIIFPV